MKTNKNPTKSWIADKLFAAPEIFLTVFGWILTLTLAWMRYPIVGKPYELNTVGYIIACVFGALLPLAIVTRWKQPRETSSLLIAPSPTLKLFWLLSVVSLGLSAFIIVYTMRMVLGSDLTLEDYRELKADAGAGSAGRIAQFNYVLMALGISSCYLTNRLGLTHKARLLFAVYLLGLFSTVYFMVGVRTAFLAPVVVFVVSFILFNIKHSNVRPLRLVLLVAVGVVALILLNAMLSAIGARGGFFGAASQSMGNRGALMLQGLGLKNPGVEASILFSFIDEYLISPVYYLDFYVNNVTHEPAWGALQFDFIARRLGFAERYIIKLDVDAAYSVLDLNWNVWATGIREVAIDSGKDFAILAFASIGMLAGMAKRGTPKSLAAGFIFSMMASFLVISPMTSLLRSSYFQYGLYFGIAWWVVDIMSRRRHLGPRSVVSAQSRPTGSRVFLS